MIAICGTDKVDECLLCCRCEVFDGCPLIIRDVQDAAEVPIDCIAGTKDLVGWEAEAGGFAFDKDFGDAEGGGEFGVGDEGCGHEVGEGGVKGCYVCGIGKVCG